MDVFSSIKKQASELGFDACGIAPYRILEKESATLQEWLDAGRHAGMSYMEKYRDLRADPARLVENTKSVIVCLASYRAPKAYPENIPQIAAYARAADYHYTVKKYLNQLLDFIRKEIPGSAGRAFVDSAPILEKCWAVEAGLGWIGKNSLLIHPELGSFCFIGIILLDAELERYDLPYEANHCGHCRHCIDSCPSGAIREEGTIDANLCLSYQTIENKGEIPEEIVPLLGDRLYGCDSCQTACPRNVKRLAPGNSSIFTPIDDIYNITTTEWQSMGSGEFKRRFGHTPIFRTGLKKLKQTLEQKGNKLYNQKTEP